MAIVGHGFRRRGIPGSQFTKDGCGSGFVLEHVKRRFQDAGLALGILRLSEGITVPKGHAQSPGWPDLLGDFTKEHEAHRGDALALKFRCHQRDGLVADRTDGNQHGDVHAIGAQGGCSGRCRVADQSTGRGLRSHEGQVPGRHGADASRGGHFTKPVERESEVSVPVQASVIKHGAAVVFLKRGHLGGSGEEAKGRITPANMFVEGRLAGSRESGAGCQCDGALSQRFLEWNPRDGVNPAPGIGRQKQADG